MNISQRRQAGAVLLTSLMVLVVLTLLVISMVRSNVLQLRIGGASQVAAEVVADADAAIAAFMNDDANIKQFYPGAQPQVNLCSSGYDCTLDEFAYLLDVTLQATQVECGSFDGIEYGKTLAKNMMGTGKAPDFILFDIRAEAVNAVFNGRAVVHQGIRAILGPGSCPPPA